jgi:dihydrofolate reductase
MRKVIVQQLVSADGFAADPSGGLDFFGAVSDYAEVDRDNLEQISSVDTILLGANTYRMFVEYWPTAEDEPMSRAVNTVRKLVFSSTLETAPWGGWNPAEVVRGDAADHVADLRRQPGGDIMVWGSISLTRSLFEAGLVDELQLRVIPVLIGAGRTLTPDSGNPRAMRLDEAKAYASGIVSLRYAVAR